MQNMDIFSAKEDLHTLYHGSSAKLKNPVFGAGKSDNDYGSGFYTTEDYTKAHAWALLNGDEKNAYVNEYTIDFSFLNVVYLNDYGLLAWLAEILANRGLNYEYSELAVSTIIDKYRIDSNNADIIVGYRADDSYIEVISAFLEGLLSIDDVKYLFQKGDLGNQVFLKSQKAFDSINFIKVNVVEHDDTLTDYDQKARKYVQRYLIKRREQKIFGANIDGITIKDVLNNNYRYNKEYDYYELL